MSLTDDQIMLRESVDRFLADRYDFATRQKILGSGSFSLDIWKQFAELGWLGACVPEECGGYGGGPVEAGIFMEAFGRHLVLEPFLWTAIVGGQLLRSVLEEIGRPLQGRLIGGDLQLALATTELRSGHDLCRLDTVATRSGADWTITGAKLPVANGPRADVIFVTVRTPGRTGPGEVSLFMVERAAPGLKFRNFRTHDGHAASEITFDDVPVAASALVGGEGDALPIIEAAMDHGIAGLCAEAVGSASHLLDATVAYLKTREQYGAPLARLQVLQHRLAEMFVAKEQARAMTASAVAALAKPAAERSRAISAAKVAVTGYIRFIAQQAVQLHGGMGISEELDIAHHLKRATIAAMTFGDETAHLQRFVELEDGLRSA